MVVFIQSSGQSTAVSDSIQQQEVGGFVNPSEVHLMLTLVLKAGEFKQPDISSKTP